MGLPEQLQLVRLKLAISTHKMSNAVIHGGLSIAIVFESFAEFQLLAKISNIT